MWIDLGWKNVCLLDTQQGGKRTSDNANQHWFDNMMSPLLHRYLPYSLSSKVRTLAVSLGHVCIGMGIYKNFMIPIPLNDPIPYRFSYRFSLGEEISTNAFVCIKSLTVLICIQVTKFN